MMGFMNLSFFGLFALALWYGGREIADGNMTGGEVLTGECRKMRC